MPDYCLGLNGSATDFPIEQTMAKIHDFSFMNNETGITQELVCFGPDLKTYIDLYVNSEVMPIEEKVRFLRAAIRNFNSLPWYRRLFQKIVTCL